MENQPGVAAADHKNIMTTTVMLSMDPRSSAVEAMARAADAAATFWRPPRASAPAMGSACRRPRSTASWLVLPTRRVQPDALCRRRMRKMIHGNPRGLEPWESREAMHDIKPS